MTSIKDLKRLGAFGHKWTEVERLRLDLTVTRFVAAFYRHHARKGAKANKARKRQAQENAETWQSKAEEIWAKPQHEHKSKYDIARLIDADHANTIRRKIRKP